MKQVIPPDQVEDALLRWTGASAMVWLFSTSLWRIALRLDKGDGGDILYVVGVACTYIKGPLRWSNAVITCSDDGHTVVDQNAGFELRCSSVTLAIGPWNEADTSFENFLGGPRPGDDDA
jgi:hypothetical protein